MPDPTGLMGAVSSASQFGSDMFNVGMTQQANKQQRQWSEQMYDKQYANALNFWKLQNDYNSPAEQMKRFEAAGLNKNLIYGQGNNGNANAIQTPDIQPVNFRAPQVASSQMDGLGMLNAMADLRIKAAQADNLKAQNTVILQDALLRQFQARNSEFDYGYKVDLRDINADYRREELRGLTNSIDINTRRDAREAVLNSASVAELSQRVKNMLAESKNIPLTGELLRAQTSETWQRKYKGEQESMNLGIDNILKNMDVQLRNQGIMPHDPWYTRGMSKLIDEILNGDYSVKPSASDKNWVRQK